jgi:hypothetical protein
MKFRKLRIAWSVAWGVVAVLLCVLWVRSYWVSDSLLLPKGNRITVMRGWIYVNERFNISKNASVPSPQYNATSSSGIPIPDGVGPHIPLWCFAAVTSTLTVLPWFRFRFSLRTLLIATTLVAVGLGLIVFVVRSR